MARWFVRNAAGERGKFETSATCATICGESQAGGIGGRNSLGEFNRIGFHVVAVTLPGLVPNHIHFPVGTVPVHTASEPSNCARAITAAATRLPRSIPAR